MENYAEKRKYPRVNVNCPIALLLSNDEIVKATIHDISTGGIQIRCDKNTAHKVQHEYECIKETTSTRFNVTFISPRKNRQEKVKTACRLVYILRQDEDVYAIGMEFVDLEENNRVRLEKLTENPADHI